MLSTIKKIYHKYSESMIFQILGKWYRNGFFISNYFAYLRMKQLSQMKKIKHEKIKVVFIAQYAQVWNKLQSVFEKMLLDERFEVVLLAVPENIQNLNDNIYEYFRKIYGKNVVNARKNNTWYDLKGMEPDYVFFQRPYDQYLPTAYRSGIVSKYAKICYVSYGFSLIEKLEDVCYSKIFFRNVYYFFSEADMLVNFNRNRFKISHEKGYRKTIDIGYPSFEGFMKQRKEEQKEEGIKFKVVWTPRWTEDKQLGGSNFMKFKEKVIELPKMISGLQLIFRPHPMTFAHMVEINKMTQEEVNQYLQNFENNKYLKYDNTKDYANVFWNSDAMLTDISGVIVEYFITGKPIVYCETGAKPDAIFKEISDTLYVVSTWEEAEEKLIQLSQGIDPMKEIRKQKIKKLFGEDFLHISDKFLDEIYEDYRS